MDGWMDGWVDGWMAMDEVERRDSRWVRGQLERGDLKGGGWYAIGCS
jgi:hypothetical protein